MKAIEKISQELFDDLRNPFVQNLSMGDAESLAVTEPEDARKFAFNFTIGKIVLGTVQITLNSNDQSLEVMFDHDLLDKIEKTETPEAQARAKRVWFRFLRRMRKFATTNNLMTFNINNDTQDHMNKKDAEMYSVDELKEGKMSKLAGSTKSSYQRVGENRIIIRHVGPIDEEKMGSRTRNIKAIYIENASGERFLVKENSLIGARILAHHMSAGGNLMDDFSNHLYTMIREMRDLKSFVLGSRNKVFESDDANQMVSAATEYYKALRETVRSLSTGRGYARYLESFDPKIDETNIDAEALKEKFVIRTFNEKFEAALPHIAKAYQKKILEQNALYGSAQNYIDGETKFGLTESDVELYKSMKFESGQALSKKVLEHIASLLQGTDSKLSEFALHSAEKFSTITEAPESQTWLHQELAMNLVKGFVAEMNNLNEKPLNPYAIGMAQAMKSTGDEPPLKKSTIKKAHHIADVINKEQGVAEGRIDEGVIDSLTGVADKIKAMPGIQKFIQAAQAKKNELIQAAQNSRTGADLVKNIQAVMGGQQAVAEDWGDKLKGGFVASAGGSLMAAGAELFMRTWFAMGKPDLTQMMNDPSRDGRIVLALVSMLVLVGALSLFGGGYMFKQGLEKDSQPKGKLPEQGVAEADISGATMKMIQVGDIVMYIDQKAEVVAMSKDRKRARITIEKGMGSVTQDVNISDLNQLGQGVAEAKSPEEFLGQIRKMAAPVATKQSQVGSKFDEIYDRVEVALMSSGVVTDDLEYDIERALKSLKIKPKPSLIDKIVQELHNRGSQALDHYDDPWGDKGVAEGVNDPHIFKCIFLFGPMGAGKSTVAKPLLSHTGLRSVNLDNFNEMFIKKGQVPTGHLSPDQLEKSWQLSQTQQQNFTDGRLGIIIDGSGRNPETAIGVIKKLQPLGYEFMMIFVNVSEATSIARQQSRADKQQQQWGVGRQVEPELAKNTYDQVQKNLAKYSAYFGPQRFIYVDNENTPDLTQATKKVDAFLRTPVTQPEALEWVQTQKGGNQVAQQQKKLATAQDSQQKALKQYNPLNPKFAKQGVAEAQLDEGAVDKLKELYQSLVSKVRTITNFKQYYDAAKLKQQEVVDAIKTSKNAEELKQKIAAIAESAPVMEEFDPPPATASVAALAVGLFETWAAQVVGVYSQMAVGTGADIVGGLMFGVLGQVGCIGLALYYAIKANQLRKRNQGVAEDMNVFEDDQVRPQGRILKSLRDMAIMSPTLTFQNFRQAGKESIITDAIMAAKVLKRYYQQKGNQTAAQFLYNLENELDDFRRGYNGSTDNLDLSDLSRGTLGKMQFQTKQGVAEGLDNKELYGLKLGDVVKARVDDSIVQGNVIDLFPETMEVELLLRGDMAGRTVTVDVRDTEYMDESGVAEERKVTKNEKGDVTGWSDETPWQKANPNKQKSGKAANLAGKALKQTQKMADEEPKISESKATINDKMFTDTLAMLKKYSGI